MKRKILYSLLGVLLVLGLWHRKLIAYGIGQAKGQLSIIWQSREVADVLNDEQVPDSVKQKLQLIQEVKQFTETALGFQSSKNYSTFYDQKGAPSLWVVTAAKPYMLEPKEWHFPFLGNVPYKGFFEYPKAEKEEALWKEQYDTNIRVAGGWSTLGWFRDPVLSNMLMDPPGDLANTIVHELTHQNIFIKDSVEFNENLASFFGDQGARRFLKMHYGEDSEELLRYQNARKDRQKFTDHILRGADYLDSLYQQMALMSAETDRNSYKKDAINEIIISFDTLNLYEKDRYRRFLHEKRINNAFFMSYLRYRGDFTFFEKELRDNFKGDLKRYFAYFKEQNR